MSGPREQKTGTMIQSFYVWKMTRSYLDPTQFRD